MASFVPKAYTPSEAVDFFHNSVPRLNVYTMSSMNATEWAFTDLATLQPMDMLEDKGTPLANYSIGLVSLPLIIMIVGISSVIILQLILFFRMCCKCLDGTPTDEEIENREMIIKHRNRAVWGFTFFMIVMLLADHALYFPSNDLDEGKDNIVTSLTLLQEIFNDIISYVKGMKIEADELYNHVYQIQNDANVCVDMSSVTQEKKDMIQTVLDSSDALKSACTTIIDIVGNVPNLLDTMIKAVNEAGDDSKTYAMYAMYAFILFLNLIFMFGACIASKCVMIFGFIIGEIVCIAATIVCSILMIIITAYADFCMDPARNLATLVPGNTGDLVNYFATCSGINPFEASITTSQETIDNFGDKNDSNSYMSNLDNLCSENYPVADMEEELSTISDRLGDIKLKISCEPMYNVYNTFMNKAMCTNSFDGLYKIWAVAFITSLSLYGVMCFGSVMWQYFGTAWKLRPKDIHTGANAHLTGTAMSHVDTNEALQYKQEYTFTAPSPSTPTLTRKEIEMI